MSYHGKQLKRPRGDEYQKAMREVRRTRASLRVARIHAKAARRQLQESLIVETDKLDFSLRDRRRIQKVLDTYLKTRTRLMKAKADYASTTNAAVWASKAEISEV